VEVISEGGGAKTFLGTSLSAPVFNGNEVSESGDLADASETDSRGCCIGFPLTSPAAAAAVDEDGGVGDGAEGEGLPPGHFPPNLMHSLALLAPVSPRQSQPFETWSGRAPPLGRLLRRPRSRSPRPSSPRPCGTNWASSSSGENEEGLLLLSLPPGGKEDAAGSVGSDEIVVAAEERRRRRKTSSAVFSPGRSRPTTSRQRLFRCFLATKRWKKKRSEQ